MARRPRCFLAGYAYHVVHRGNRKADIFLDDVDRGVYLKLLRTQCTEHHVRIWAYCLMDNHVHHVAVPDQDRALSAAVAHCALLHKKSVFRAGELPAWIRRGGCALKKFRYASLLRADGVVD